MLQKEFEYACLGFVVTDLTYKSWSRHSQFNIDHRNGIIQLFLLFLSQMLSRAKPAVGRDLPHTDKRKKKGRKIPKLEELLSQRDFTGAITLLEVMSKEGCFLGGEKPEYRGMHG